LEAEVDGYGDFLNVIELKNNTNKDINGDSLNVIELKNNTNKDINGDSLNVIEVKNNTNKDINGDSLNVIELKNNTNKDINTEKTEKPENYKIRSYVGFFPVDANKTFTIIDKEIGKDFKKIEDDLKELKNTIERKIKHLNKLYTNK
jgi:hypothetical protein